MALSYVTPLTHDRWVKVAVHSDKPMAFPVLKDDKFIYFDALKSIEGCTNEIQKTSSWKTRVYSTS